MILGSSASPTAPSIAQSFLMSLAQLFVRMDQCPVCPELLPEFLKEPALVALALRPLDELARQLVFRPRDEKVCTCHKYRRLFPKVFVSIHAEFMPHAIDDGKSDGETKPENPGKVPHDRIASLIEIGVGLDIAKRDTSEHYPHNPGRVTQYDRQKDDRYEQHDPQGQVAR